MGTRSRIIFKTTDGKDVCGVYKQYDGHPDARGVALAKFLCDATIVNGFSRSGKNIHNGMCCMAATWIKNEKDTTGDVYLAPTGADHFSCDEDYVYVVCNQHMLVETPDGGLFDGEAVDFLRKYAPSTLTKDRR